MNETKWTEVPFEIMLQCDGEMKCECWLLSNSINKYGIDLRRPMLFNEFLKQIGTHLTSMNCQSLFGQSRWFVIDDGVQPEFFMQQENTTKQVQENAMKTIAMLKENEELANFVEELEEGNNF